MPKWINSASVVLGALGAALGGLATGGFVAVDLAAALGGVLSGLIAVLRFRPSAGKSITDLQASNPN